MKRRPAEPSLQHGARARQPEEVERSDAATRAMPAAATSTHAPGATTATTAATSDAHLAFAGG
ncbi:hypothetical protein PV729_20575 [Streptomyces europaeiscabiei]|uniref:Uncharacterized protein n=1 Tax=Streptomyces europaeiscabiei TaxID=146819 RepID=A0ABU4NA31_9ACTN|nr:hypothetical protein [Streptomyces europaeiscabiei]MDX2772097.1 hypothetical protein [Streptomyces europaeiscabiei]MDX3541081.1 hypothetical protein [Streptomyces europaeiscabiei]MDX3554141.1 hypothetical protein [Streptomyces europaeiscabiei]MDX3699608.1 hypothetical protein [Streptomyces europaeiscabiei]